MHGVVLLIVKTDAGLVLADSLVGEGLQQVDALVHHDLVSLIGVLVVNQIELVAGEFLDGEVGAADCAFPGEDVGGFGDSAGQDVVNVGLVCVHVYSR